MWHDSFTIHNSLFTIHYCSPRLTRANKAFPQPSMRVGQFKNAFGVPLHTHHPTVGWTLEGLDQLVVRRGGEGGSLHPRRQSGDVHALVMVSVDSQRKATDGLGQAAVGEQSHLVQHRILGI